MAGLPDIELADTQPGYSLDALREELQEELSEGDLKLLEQYFFQNHDVAKHTDEELFQFMSDAINNCRNKTIRDWWQMNLDINNFMTAMLARKQGWAPADFIQGEGEMQEMIVQNGTSKDFELGRVYDNIKELVAVVDEEDPVKKEKMIDAMKWLWLEEATFYDPFSIDAVFAYLCKLEMQERWAKLDVKQGEETFKQIIENLRGEARVPQEFIRK